MVVVRKRFSKPVYTSCAWAHGSELAKTFLDEILWLDVIVESAVANDTVASIEAASINAPLIVRG